jgi:hypothetical protein
MYLFQCSNINFDKNLETRVAEYNPARERLIPVAEVKGNFLNFGSCLNGMDSSSPKRHLGARLEVLITSHEREGVHYEQA